MFKLIVNCDLRNDCRLWSEELDWLYLFYAFLFLCLLVFWWRATINQVTILPPHRLSGKQKQKQTEKQKKFALIWLLFMALLTQARTNQKTTTKVCINLSTVYDILDTINQSGLTMPLSKHSVRNYQKMSSHATCQGTLGHSCNSSLSHCGLILA